MKISLSWIKNYVPLKAGLDDIVDRLTLSGTEVEHVEKAGKDSVLEMEVTPNRADCLSHWGLARELSAIYNCPRKAVKKYTHVIKQAKGIVNIESLEDCSYYSGTLIDGVSVRPANKTMQTYLNALGIRPISNIVDVTNFCLLELGQPMHAFDYDKLEGGKVVVRRARKGESLVTLDGENRELDPSILVIADAKRPVAIAGVMGGKDTEVTSQTKRILLECAHFDQVLIRRTSRKLGLSSDSSYRFERGIDRDNINEAKKRAIFLIGQEAGGKVLREQISKSSRKVRQGKIAVGMDRLNERLGSKISKAKCATILRNLDFEVKTSKDALSVIAPTFRPDVNSFVDIVEEIARVIGYDNIPQALPSISAANVPDNPLRKVREAIVTKCVAQGLSEIITYSMINLEALKKSNTDDSHLVAINNPLTQDQTHMRPSMLPGAMDVLRTNINRGQKDLRLFELGKVFNAKEERWALSLTMTGRVLDDWRLLKKGDADFYDLKGLVELLFHSLKMENISFKTEQLPAFDKSQSASVEAGGKHIGCLGKLSGAVLDQWGIKASDVYYAELDVDLICRWANIEKNYIPVSEYPSIHQDISLAVLLDISYDQIKGVVWKEGGPLLKAMNFKELYLGEKLPDNHRGVVFSLRFQSSKETLKESEVLSIVDKISKSLSNDLGAIKR